MRRELPKGLGRCLIIVALTFLLGACSALRLGYGSAPDVTYWWLDRYLDFEGEQTPRVRDAIARWFAWHRQTQLVDYADQLARAKTEVLGDTTPARACEWQAALVKRARVAYERIAPDAAAVTTMITPRQIAHLERRYDGYNAEYREAYLQPDPAARAAESLKRVVDRAEMLYGRLEAPQKRRIAETLTRSPFDPELWLAERRARQQDALRILRAGSGMTPAQALVALNGYAERLERSPRPAYQRYVAQLNEFNCGFAAEIHNGTDAVQRRRAAERLAGWEQDLRVIAATSVKPRPAEP